MGVTDGPRERAVRARLQALEPAGESDLPICWVVGGPSTYDERGFARLDVGLSLDAAAARLGHLTLHRALPPLGSTGDCDAEVRAWVRSEAEGWTRETALRERAGLPSEGPLEASVRGAVTNRLGVAERWLWDHPLGSEGVPGYVAGYTRRCARVRVGEGVR